MSTIEAVKELRRHTGESQQIFATRLGLSVRAISNYETKRPPTGRALVALAHAAAEAGRHDLAYVFTRALMQELDARRLRLGLFSSDATGQDPAGFMLLCFEGRDAKNFARGFFETFGRYLYGNPEERRRAEKLLQDFNNAALWEWRAQ